MTHSAPLETLFHPFATGDVPPPAGRALFINAQSHAALKQWDSVDCQQPFYPYAQGLSLPQTATPPYQTALVIISKDKTAAQYELARAFEALDKGGLLIASAANDANGNRIESWFKDMGLKAYSQSKNKCRVVWAIKDDQAITPFEWLLRGGMQQVEIGDQPYWTLPGLFGWDKIDIGSALLAQHLPQGLSGNGADFGCGYGYLSAQILKNNTPSSLLAIDADQRAVECCQKNCAAVTGVWGDLTVPWNGAPLDWIVMNPPFHMGKMTDSDIGLAFIRTAASALKKGGALYMVANRHLPYETAMSKMFSKIDIPAQTNGFKLIFAQK